MFGYSFELFLFPHINIHIDYKFVPPKIYKKMETKTELIHILLRESDKDGTNGDDKYV